jgi:hypothetical protein
MLNILKNVITYCISMLFIKCSSPGLYNIQISRKLTFSERILITYLFPWKLNEIDLLTLSFSTVKRKCCSTLVLF